METLPVDANDLTPEWLSEALGTEVAGVELLDHAFATNQRARDRPHLRDSRRRPDSLFVKLAPDRPRRTAR